MEQLVLLLIIAAISLVNWLIEKSAKLREEKRLEKLRREREEQQNSFPRQAAQPPPAPQPLPEPIPAPAAPSRTQEELRRMLESLGFPIEEEEQAPPPPLPRAEPTPEPAFPGEPAPGIPEVRQPAPRPRSIPAQVAARRPNPWAEKLRTHEGFREAFALREIIGPPRCLEPYSP
jgi:hypothetical protein